MEQINIIDILRLHTDECYGFLAQVAKQTNLVTVEADQEFINTFKLSALAFGEALKPSVKNSFTQARKEADEVADNLWSGANMLTQAMTFHPYQEVKTIANKVMDIFVKYGRLTKMGYKEEYPNMEALINELKALPANEVDALNLRVWIDSMATAYNNFVSITEEKISEDAQKHVGITRQSREACEEAYRAMVNRINSGASYNGVEPYQVFINNVNAIISEYKALIASRYTRNSNKKDKE